MKRAKILYDGEPVWGIVEGKWIKLDNEKRVSVLEASYLPPVNPSKIIAVHLSYRSRTVEYQMKQTPPYPSYFMKPPSSLSHHGAAVKRPKGCRFLNYEGEIAIVIGRKCRNVSIDDALSYVAGYTVANDWGLHDFRHADRGSMFRVKGQDGYCPIGPFIVDARDVNPDNMNIRTYVNNVVVQQTNTGSDLLFSFAYMIADIARFITLEPGDVLLSGTPANSRPVEIGDIVEVEVDGIGRLTNTVVEADEEVELVGDPPKISEATLHVALTISEEEAKEQIGKSNGKGFIQ
ncbi:fumarylacetoacetate hydrolase family protein [Ferviditalea candida]|uniref:Fumarylacetoacetate hydrolase family protein n=1 Tax=Ferviditalea candida TaxID=3108399 RepID=A0ABU5ZME0_9BACL|nr:fumarylacetoacetate hydrolase family protein [Paenibacillaceae bacterium T2]